jgi:hypothetical protein
MGDKVDLNLRLKVATFDGYHDFRTHMPQNRISAREDVGGRFIEVPYYELSLDVIAEACDRHNIGFSLKGAVDAKEGYEYVATCTNAEPISGAGSTRAIAVCHLFVAVMTERSLEKERAMKRDRLGRKIAEEALEMASQCLDFEQVYTPSFF